MASKFDPIKIQEKWIKKWQETGIFQSVPDKKKKKFYLTVAFPYPSGSMHVGHGRTYTVPDVIARFKRMQGYNVLFPMAWHVTGSPVLGIAERIKKRDEKTLKIYGELYKVPKEILENFTNPETIVKYFSNEYRQNMTEMGFSIDWTREFLSITPQYSKFIEWQYKHLYEQGLIKMGEHPVRYCPSCDNPVGDHDLLQGENSEVQDFTVIKFKFNDMILPAATLRPETIFGVTNIWINPNIDYVRVKVDNEIWILSREATGKLKYLGKKIEVIEQIKGREFVGKSCIEPISGREIPILPAEFVDPDYATGVVMSVPAHAPYDYVALRDLKSEMAPIVIIGEGKEVPAKKIVEYLNIKDQKDPKLEEATELLYREEFGRGRMSKSVRGYGDLSVREAREKVIAELKDSGNSDIFYEFSENPVICRCGTRCFIKILKDQWFLNYGNPEWKEKAHECLNSMQIVPEETRQNFSYFIDWLKDWACTRRVGLGTRFPWDKKWLIEPLSDSTIYMAFYTISRHVKELDAEKLDPEFFDYVLLGNGDADKISNKIGIRRERLEEIRGEFLYWYSPEWRLSAKDLVGNHLTFHIFHHTAIFPKEQWPRGIVVFGMGLLEGNKMSSSKGNVVLLSDAINENGSDVVRLFLMSNAEPWQDFDWRENLVKNTSKKLKQFYDQVNYAIMLKNNIPERDIDRWLISRLDNAIEKTTSALEGFQTRKALQHAFFELLNDLAWYSRRCEPNSKTMKEFAEKWVRLMAPFTPFVCEDLWEKMGNRNFISIAEYPRIDKKIDERINAKEDIIKSIMADIQSIIEVTKIKPRKIYLYPAPEWKRKLFEMIKSGKTISDVMKDPEMKKYGKEVPQIMQKFRKDEIPDFIFTLEEEFDIIKNAKEFLENEFSFQLEIQKEPVFDPEKKAGYAMPMKPGIYIEI